MNSPKSKPPIKNKLPKDNAAPKANAKETTKVVTSKPNEKNPAT